MAEEPESWRAAQSGSEMVAWLTADELKEMNDALTAVLDRHIERLTDPVQRPEGARLCEFVVWGVPDVLPRRGPCMRKLFARPGFPSSLRRAEGRRCSATP